MTQRLLSLLTCIVLWSSPLGAWQQEQRSIQEWVEVRICTEGVGGERYLEVRRFRTFRGFGQERDRIDETVEIRLPWGHTP